MPFPATKQVLERGQERYNIYCSPCHSQLGDGNGMIVQRGFKRPPSYHIDRLRKAPIGHFFNVMTNGYGAMADYSAQVPVNDRWAIAAYIRVLQLSQNATPADVPAGAAIATQPPQVNSNWPPPIANTKAMHGEGADCAKGRTNDGSRIFTARSSHPPVALLQRWRGRALAVGIAGGILTILGAFVSPDELLRGYLIGFMVCLSFTLGSMAWLMVGHMTGGNWWMLGRRVFEAAIKTLPLVTAMFIPILLGMHRLVPVDAPG